MSVLSPSRLQDCPHLDVPAARRFLALPGCTATLGPPGTSSEATARFLAASLDLSQQDAPTVLYDSYEEAAEAVLAGEAVRLLVANAYDGVNRFYMDLRLQLERAFVLDTPLYGLACRPDAPLPSRCRIVTHPAPRDLVMQLIPPGYRVDSIELAASTSAAAERAADLAEIDLALTTEPAAVRSGLVFISPTRPIRMLWSVFTRCASPATSGGVTGQ